MSASGTAVSRVDRTEERQLLKDSVSGFVARSKGASRARALRGRSPSFDPSVWREMAELGWLGVTLPERHGGLGLSLSEMAVIAEGLGGAVAPEPIIEVATLAAGVLCRAPDGIAEEILPRMAAGDVIPALAWQETDGSLDPECLATSVQTTRGTTRLNGVKAFVPHADAADGFIVSAKSEQGVALCWVPAGSQGVNISIRPLASGSMVGRVTFDQVEVQGDHLIGAGQAAVRALNIAIDEATVMASAALVGLMSKALDMTLEYLKTRVQFGKPIGSFQALQHRAVDLYIQRELSKAALGEALLAFGDGTDSPASRSAASRVKARCSDAALVICRDALQMHGAIGYTDEYDLGLYLNRALVLSAWLGNSAHHRRRYANVERRSPRGVAS
jgi:alkylation response protein AidB-like acyl-CoA dehydrogenase